MQSEMACHIGSMGKYFCRICKVKGHDTAGKESNPARDTTQAQNGNDSIGEEFSGSESEAHNDTSLNSARKRTKETMEELVTRVKQFVKVMLDISGRWTLIASNC
jgi:hypothetical protein